MFGKWNHIEKSFKFTFLWFFLNNKFILKLNWVVVDKSPEGYYPKVIARNVKKRWGSRYPQAVLIPIIWKILSKPIIWKILSERFCAKVMCYDWNVSAKLIQVQSSYLLKSLGLMTFLSWLISLLDSFSCWLLPPKGTLFSRIFCSFKSSSDSDDCLLATKKSLDCLSRVMVEKLRRIT